jgi:hypothetical protein
MSNVFYDRRNIGREITLDAGEVHADFGAM